MSTEAEHAEGSPAGPDHAGTDQRPISAYAHRIMAIRDLLVERGIVSEGDISRARRVMEARSPALGARLVARAWIDESFRERLTADTARAAAELGITVGDYPKVEVLPNSEELHHLVVCTLCSCYPRPLLGRPPDWYKSLAYRSRAVREPRAVLSEFGVELGPHVTVRVVDSTADLRYLVLPRRPAGSEGLSEEELTALVTRDSMIGAGLARAPGPRR
jgi:nitrile hydratase subunit alpha